MARHGVAGSGGEILRLNPQDFEGGGVPAG
jgi:hypothetical protein